jgi:hypothetical protein
MNQGGRGLHHRAGGDATDQRVVAERLQHGRGLVSRRVDAKLLRRVTEQARDGPARETPTKPHTRCLSDALRQLLIPRSLDAAT